MNGADGVCGWSRVEGERVIHLVDAACSIPSPLVLLRIDLLLRFLLLILILSASILVFPPLILFHHSSSSTHAGEQKKLTPAMISCSSVLGTLARPGWSTSMICVEWWCRQT